MKHHLLHVLRHWQPRKDAHQWLLATVIDTEGSSYRKAGAMMLFNDSGEQLGVVSGGCLESDILHQARMCWESGRAKTVTYDMQEEGDIAWRLGIGCGGEVTLLLQPVTADADYLGLAQVLTLLESGQSLTYAVETASSHPGARINDPSAEGRNWFSHRITPPPALVILGGGVDARPVAQMANLLGWRVHVNDPRARYARAEDFSGCAVTGISTDHLNDATWLTDANAVIVMHHQVTMDADALAYLAHSAVPQLRYLALLGPSHRCDKVLSEANIQPSSLPVELQSPAGLALGGELPESIALSMIAQAHAVLHDKSAVPLKGKPCSFG
ncbi:XdhC family protein [Alteromonas antoniana]|uniref:XdhC family protein n=1 Tax=Alteromonas antoniana TaxID=2803813 RepID=UPI001C457D56|nr:XdhC family protein [Alteromonas antoniana]